MRLASFPPLLAVFFLLSGSTSAADETLFGRESDRYGVKYPAATFTMFGGTYLRGLDQHLYTASDKLKDAWNMGLRAGWAFDPYFELEAAFGFGWTQTSTVMEDVYIYAFNGLGQLPLTDNLVPYITLGVGGITFVPDGGVKDDDFAINYGAGLKWFMFKNLALRPDIRGLTSFNVTHTALLITLNLTYYLTFRQNAEKTPAPVTSVPAKELLKENPPEPVVVPTPVPTPAPSPTPEPAPTLTPAPAPSVEFRDELKEFSGVIQGVRFQTGSSKILPTSYVKLNRAAEFFKRHPQLKVRIEGHTDDTGGANRNMRLSRARAQSVLRYLQEKGVAAEKFETVGYGALRPVAANSTVQGRAQNRRIEFTILNPEAL